MAASEDEASFTLGVKAQMSEVDVAAASLKNFREQMKDDTAALKQYESQLRALKGANIKTGGAVDALKASIAEKKKAIGTTQLAMIKLEESSKKLPGGFKAVTDSMKKIEPSAIKQLTEAAKQMPGPIGAAAGKLEFLRKVVSTGAFKLAAMAAGITLLVAVTIKAIKSLANYTVEQANARRSELLRLEGIGKIRTMFSMMAGVHDQSGKQMQGSIDKLTSRYAVSRDQLVQYGTQLHNLNLRGKQWESALEGMAIKASTQGDAQAQLFAGWASYYNYAGRSVDTLTDKVKTRLGGIAKAQMKDATVQAGKLQESFAMLTSGVDIEPLLTAKKEFNDIFSQNTASGEYLKGLFGRMMQPLIDGLTAAWHFMKIVFQDAIILALELDNAYLRLKISLKKAFAMGDAKQALQGLKDPLAHMLIIFAALGSALIIQGIIALGGALLGLAAAALPLAASMLVAAAPFLLVGAAIAGLILLVTNLYDLWNEIDWSGLGKSVIDGLLHGLDTAADAVGKVVDGIASDIMSAFKGALGISSPSKVFAGYGKEIPRGVALGIKQAAPEAKEAAAKMAPKAPAPMEAKPAAAGGGGARGNTTTVNLGGITVNAASGDTAQSLAADLQREIERIFEGLAVQLGGGGDGQSA